MLPIEQCFGYKYFFKKNFLSKLSTFIFLFIILKPIDESPIFPVTQMSSLILTPVLFIILPFDIYPKKLAEIIILFDLDKSPPIRKKLYFFLQKI